ncbi:MAG: ATP phosphoribosyltransferase regulatory subunit, partial [Candidatus Acidiferrum sp.]
MSEGAAKKPEKPRKFQAIRGTRDLLPPDTALWNHVEQTAHEVFSTYGFGEIRPPVIEPTELFARAVGSDTDIVSKEMFSFADPANIMKTLAQDALEAGLGVDMVNFEERFRSSIEEKMQFISLRPEATASVCRAYIEHNMQQMPQPVKLYYIGPMFRR